MATPVRTQPAAKRTATVSTKPGKGEVKVSVVNICGPYSADIKGQIHQQTAMPARSRCKPRPRVSHLMHLEPAPAANKPLISSREASKLQIGTCLNKDGVSRRAGQSKQPLTGKLRPLCVSGASVPTLNQCLGIQPQHKRIQKTPDGPPPL